MIDSKSKLREYLEADKIALGKNDQKRPRLFGDEIWKFEIVLRKYEYYLNKKKNVLAILLCLLYKILYYQKSSKYQYFIPPNVFDKGLSIAHKGVIVIHPNARIGKFCRIQEMVNVGATNGSIDAATIGDFCFLGSGSKVIGNVTITDFVAVGANAVVVRDINIPHSTWAGVPAKKISDNDSRQNLCQDIFKKVNEVNDG